MQMVLTSPAAADYLPDLGGSSRESGQTGFQKPLAPTEQPPSQGKALACSGLSLWRFIERNLGSLTACAHLMMRPGRNVIPKKFPIARKLRANTIPCTDDCIDSSSSLSLFLAQLH